MSDRDTREARERTKPSRGDSRSRSPPEEGATTSLLVRNLSYRIRGDDIRRLMGKYGEIRDVYIPQDFYTKRPRGFAFVEFYHRRDASDALHNMDRYRMDDREISVVFAKDRRKTSDEMRHMAHDPPRSIGGYESRERDYRGGGDRGRRADNCHSRDERSYHRSFSRSRSRDRGGRSGRAEHYSNGDNRRPESPPPVPRERERERERIPPPTRSPQRSPSANV